MHLFRKLRIYISIKNNLIFGVVVINVRWSQNRVIFVVFGPDRLRIRQSKLISRVGLPSECHWPLYSFYSGGLPQGVLEDVPAAFQNLACPAKFNDCLAHHRRALHRHSGRR